MAIIVARTLEFMADVYSQSSSGGPRSPRFAAYANAAAAAVPVHGYNPMTNKPVRATVEALIDRRAEQRLEAVANFTARRLGYENDEVMHITVATPGMWTDRLATEIDHRLLPKDPGGVLLWCGESVDEETLTFEFITQTVRLVYLRISGAPTNLAAAAHQEGRAAAFAGKTGVSNAAAAEALDVLSNDTSLATMVAFLYGDDAAARLGFTTLGLADRTGYEHAIALASAELR
jgi:hypothetical protein